MNKQADRGVIDWNIVFAVLMLAIIGLASIYVAATHDTGSVSVTRMVTMQGLWYVIGIIAVAVIMQFDSERLWRVAPYVFAIGTFLMVAVLIFYSKTYYVETGGKSWFAIGGLTFQPSEIMKPAFILMLGRVITAHNVQHPEHSWNSDRLLLSKITLWTAPIILLVLAQHDFGTMLVFLAIV
ncbi:FtsW/RodA/SpoVE family cell cycle protein, partial [Weissella soli]